MAFTDADPVHYIICIYQINGKEITKKRYIPAEDLTTILSFLDGIVKDIKNIVLMRISLYTTQSRVNLSKINKLTKDIITSDFVKNYCEYHGNKILIYEEKLDMKRRFYIVISNTEQFKNADPHTNIKTRDDYHEDRKYYADPY